MTKEKNESQRICVSSNGEISRLLEIMKRLRDPKDGCPWDIEQTYETIAPYTIEEAYEVSDAIDQGNWHELEGELGDLLLQVIYFTQIGSEDGHFSFESVVKNVSDKMIRRHPHVFGDKKQYKSSDQQIRDWEKIKEQERSKNTPSKTLDGIAGNLPALTYATKLQKRAARANYLEPDISGVTDKISEEIDELNEARNELSLDAQEEEYGDLMFVMVNFARHLKIDPEKALRGANKKFKKRFEQVEKELALIGKTPIKSDLSEMDNLWNVVKQKENR